MLTFVCCISQQNMHVKTDLKVFELQRINNSKRNRGDTIIHKHMLSCFISTVLLHDLLKSHLRINNKNH